MRTVDTINELKANMDILENYLNSKTDPQYSFALNLIKKGTCFVAVKNPKGYKFFPSRFIGYANNTMDKHLNNDNRDGRETNLVISGLLGTPPLPNHELDNLYREYCRSLGFIANNKGSFGVERKYWIF